MTIQAFTSQLLSSFRKRLWEGEKVQAVEYVGNNGARMTSLVLSKKGREDFRIGSMEEYYEMIKSGEEMETFVADVLRLFHSQSDIKIMDGNRNDFSSIRGQITYRLIHYGKNVDELKDRVYIPWQEFAIVFYIIELDEPYGICSVPVMEEDIKTWGISVEEVYHTAAKNTPLLLPLQIRSIHEIIEAEDGQHADMEGIPWEGTPELLVLSNRLCMYGASAILYEGALEGVARKLNHDFYLVPVSVHEFLAVSSQSADPDELREWHRSSIEILLDQERWLSDEIYLYRKEHEDLVWVPENRLFS